LLAAVAAKPVDATNIGELSGSERPGHFVAGRMAVGIVDTFEPVEIKQRVEKGAFEVSAVSVDLTPFAISAVGFKNVNSTSPSVCCGWGGSSAQKLRAKPLGLVSFRLRVP